MKRFLSTLIMGIVCTAAVMAQTNPNRVLITDKIGNVKGFLTERIDSIWFAKVEGRIAAGIEFLGFRQGGEEDTVQLAITRTEGCEAFRIDCITKNMADMLDSEDAIANYLDNTGSEYYWQDFTNASLTGYKFTPDVEYSIITVGYDKYGIACGAERYDFRAPKKTVVGDCSIAYEVTDVTTDAITIKFTPGSGVSGYAACSFPAGTAEQQFAMMGAMFGFTSLGDMVKAFGFQNSGEATNTWTAMDPGTDYEIYVQAWDVNGTYADMLIIPVTTKKLGGEGVAEVEISVGDFGGYAATGYWQIVTYTPNDQTSMHRDMLIEKEEYEQEWGEDKIIEYLKTDNPFDSYWNQYGVDVAYWTADPDTEYIAFAIGQNINGEWGPLASKELTTPSVPSAVAPKAGGDKGKATRIVNTAKDGKAHMPFMMGNGTVKTVQARKGLSGE